MSCTILITNLTSSKRPEHSPWPQDISLALVSSGGGMGGMASHRCLLPKPQNLWICDLTWQDSHWRHHLVKDVQLGDYTGLSTWALCNRKGPEKREAGVRRERRRCDDGISSLGERGKSDHVMLLTLQTGEGTTNRGKQVASSTWKRQEQRFFPQGLQKECSLLKPWFQPSRTLSGLRALKP